MVKHIVMFNFKDENKKENLVKAKEMLEALAVSVPTLQNIEVGINFSDEVRAMDLALYSEFKDQRGLELYTNHHAHLEVVSFIKTVASMASSTTPKNKLTVQNPKTQQTIESSYHPR
jgi:hypothetical protein